MTWRRRALVLALAAVAAACSASITPIATPSATQLPPPTLPRAAPTVHAAPTGTPAPAGTQSPAHPFSGLAPTGPTENATLIRVVDGDTIHVLLNGKDWRLRYIGMDTPEEVKPGTPVQPYARAAAAENTRLLDNQPLVLERDVSQTDRYGRLLRYVWVRQGTSWMMIGLQLVLEGYAQVETVPPDVKDAQLFIQAERIARSAGLGLWSASPAPSR